MGVVTIVFVVGLLPERFLPKKDNRDVCFFWLGSFDASLSFFFLLPEEVLLLPVIVEFSILYPVERIYDQPRGLDVAVMKMIWFLSFFGEKREKIGALD